MCGDKSAVRLRGDVVKGLPFTAQVGKNRYEEAAEDLLNDYRTNARRSLVTMTRPLIPQKLRVRSP